MNNQKGFTPIAIVIFGVLFALGFFVFIFVVVKPFDPTSSKPVDKDISPQSQNSIVGETQKATCLSKDLGGCDNEKNFYKWKDDGKP